mgnify:CR=1 FL=1|jgi:predicted glycoside hydrolase/deacetylase ChbG (UPF0249 family)
MSRALIITADDFGLTSGINEGILRGHLDGMITATSVLAVGRACDEGLALLRQTPTLDAGIHLALVGEDPPLTAPELIPSLVDDDGAFLPSIRSWAALGLVAQLDPADIRVELSAQIEKVLEAGIRPTHLDAHQHVHLLPAVASVVVDLAMEYGIPFVRIPHSRRLPVSAAVNPLAAALRRRVTAAGLLTTSTYLGLDEAGHLDQVKLLAGLERITRQTLATSHVVEVNAHPGNADDPEAERFAWGGYQWGAELSLLMDPDVRAQIEDLGYRIVGFSKLVGW